MNALTQTMNLTAGPLTLIFEPSGMIRYVRLGETEVLRGVYVAVRDRNWDTVSPLISNLSVDQQNESFAIEFDADCVRDEIDFHWHGSIKGGSDGAIAYQLQGEARSTFLRNRIGFCVLHPIRECAGQPCIVRHVDGTVTESAFPRAISPHQPFKQMRSIRHHVIDAVDAEVAFSGDVFEMEDQRNWTDASYKTYCTPLELPFPVEVRAGDRVEQTVTLSLVEGRPGSARSVGSPIARRHEVPPVEFDGRKIPPLGLCVASHGQLPSSREIERLRQLNLNHLRADVAPGDRRSLVALETAVRQSAALGVPLDLAITLSDAAGVELERLAEILDALKPRVSQYIVFHKNEKSTPAKWVELARAKLAKVAGDAMFAGGTTAYFAELNRGRPDVTAMDAVVYSINPQVHTSDDASLVETLEAQGDTVRSAQWFCGGKPVCVSPITLRPRFNPNATGEPPPPRPGELPPEVDPRQCSLLAAAWTLGSIAELTRAGAARLTYFETTGWRGVMETEAGPPLPEKFPSIAGGVYPVYHVLADLGEFAGAEIGLVVCGPGLYGVMLRMATPYAARLLIANVSSSPYDVTLPQPEQLGGRSFHGRIIDDGSVETAIREPQRFRRQAVTEIRGPTLELQPYAYSCLDVTGDITA